MYRHKLRLGTLVFAVACSAIAQNNPLITVNEHGQGTLLFPGGSPVVTVGVLAADPGPGGLPAALTYNLLGPPSLVAGDLLIQEVVGATLVLSDVVRFNPAGTGSAGYPASLVFYSDNFDGVDAIADRGFPTANYANTVLLTEVGPEGSNGVVYTPTANQPGFVAGFSVTYNIISDDVPEPASLGLVGLAMISMVEVYRRRRAQ